MILLRQNSALVILLRIELFMSLFFKYIKGHRKILMFGILFFLIFTVSFLLYHLPVAAVIYPALLCFVTAAVVAFFDFIKNKKEHESVLKINFSTDLTSLKLPEVSEIKDEDYQCVINRLCDEYTSYRTETDRKYFDMINYYTVWAHQIKTPIASMRLRLQNEDSHLTRTLLNDLYRIEQYVEMVLTFLRLDSDSTDYIFKEYDLDKIIKASVKKFSNEFIDRKLSLIYEPLNTTAITDEKWLAFVIEQVLSNALKYTPNGSITIKMQAPKTLQIIDTGMGIAPEDLPRIFENGYTGYNGRLDTKASGIGLYLCRRICDELGHKISAWSEVGVGTVISIDLSQIKLEVE